MANFRNAAGRLLGKRSGQVQPAAAEAESPAASPEQAAAKTGPSPNPMSNLILADIVLRSGGALLQRAVETGLLGRTTGTTKAKRIIKGRTMTQTLVGTALARIATRSVPGAIVVGGGLLAKTLYERRRSKQAEKAGQKALDNMAQAGAEEPANE